MLYLVLTFFLTLSLGCESEVTINQLPRAASAIPGGSATPAKTTPDSSDPNTGQPAADETSIPGVTSVNPQVDYSAALALVPDTNHFNGDVVVRTMGTVFRTPTMDPRLAKNCVVSDDFQSATLTTGAGTYEIMIVGTSSDNYCDVVSKKDGAYTVLKRLKNVGELITVGSKVVFGHRNSSTDQGVYVTDGTVAGTAKISDRTFANRIGSNLGDADTQGVGVV